MDALAVTFPILAVSAIYCLWHTYRQECLRRERRLCERVAYLLWAVAHVEGPPARPAPDPGGPSQATPLRPCRCPILLVPPAPRRRPQ